MVSGDLIMGSYCWRHQYRLSHRLLLPSSIPSAAAAALPCSRSILKFPFCPAHHALVSASSALHDTRVLDGDFTWDDVVSLPELRNQSSDLGGFFDKVSRCNRNSEEQCEFVPFVVERQIVGYVHNGFTDYLRQYKDVFIFHEDSAYGGNLGCYVALHPTLSTPEERTEAVAVVVRSLGGEHIQGIRNELYPVTSSFGTPEFFSVERAAAPYFGIKAYGVHMNGYVEKDGQKYLWIGKRSKAKPTYPGKLDHLVAGGMPHGMSCVENLAKECEEEAGIPRSISSVAVAVGAVSYMDIDGYRIKRDVLFCYDLKLPEGFYPRNEDGEVESFKLLPVAHVANIIRSTHCFKENCNLVILDFLFRHGYIMPDESGYLKLLQSLRSGDCS